jgi:hypothetical protein
MKEKTLTSIALRQRICLANPPGEIPDHDFTGFYCSTESSMGESEKEIRTIISRSGGSSEVVFWQEL